MDSQSKRIRMKQKEKSLKKKSVTSKESLLQEDSNDKKSSASFVAPHPQKDKTKPFFQSKAKILSSLKKKPQFSKDAEELKTDSQEDEEQRKKEELLKIRAEKAEKEFLFLRAEFENYKRRAREEKQALIKYSGEEFISALATEVLDDLERALLASFNEKQTVEDLQKGLQMIDKKLKKLFEQSGVKVLDPKGEAFDPSYQEALSYVEKPDLPEDQVVQTFKKAYKLHDKVIRPAQVVVSKPKDSV